MSRLRAAKLPHLTANRDPATFVVGLLSFYAAPYGNNPENGDNNV
jgi:hypothetical protein